MRNLSPNTQATYLQQVSLFARQFRKSPDGWSARTRTYQIYLTNNKKLATSSIHLAVSALRFLYSVALKKGWTLKRSSRCRKGRRNCRRAEPRGSRVPRLYSAQASRNPDRLLRRRLADIRSRAAQAQGDRSARMVIRVEQGKGQKDRYVMLSPTTAGDPAWLLAPGPGRRGTGCFPAPGRAAHYQGAVGRACKSPPRLRLPQTGHPAGCGMLLP